VYEHAGDIYIQLGLTTEALNSWKKAKELNSDSKVLDQKIKLKKYIAQ
jgi:predicted negative regulator of RcsB-dependent stress response